MDSTIKIYDVSTGKEKYSALLEDGSKRVFTLMSEDHITLVFKTRKQMYFGLGDYITHPTYGRFEITKIQKPRFNSELRVYEYSLQFNAEYYKWANKKYKFEPSSARQESTFCLTDSLAKHMAILVRNLKAYGWEFEWSYNGGGAEDILSVAKYITYDNVSILSALGKIAEAFEVEWWVTDKTIHLGRVEIGYKGDPTIFEVGKNVDTISDANDVGDDYFNVFTAFGSDKNIPTNYRSTEEQIVVNGIVQHRLMLPADTPLIYLDGVTATDAVEKKVEGIVVFDDVFPRTNGKIVSIESYKANAEDTDPTTGEEITVEATFYRFKDKTLKFDESYILPGQNLSVNFKSGLLNGMTFEVKFNPKGVSKTHADYQLFEIVRNDTYGLDLPNDSLKPRVDDEYTLVGFDATKLKDLGLIDVAEQELKERALKFAKKRQIDPNNYTCEMLADYMYGRDTDGHLDKNFAKTFSLGDKIRLVDSNLFDVGYRDSRVIGFEYDLMQPFNNAKVVVGENATYSRSASMEGEINAKFEDITFNSSSIGTGGGGGGTSIYIITSNDTTAPKDTNVLSALRSNNQFLRKDVDDTASGSITFKKKSYHNQGAQFGDTFVSGIGGTGGRIDERGNGELESLSLRSWLEVPELRYNKVSIYTGIRWDTFGGGIIESVTPASDGSGVGVGVLKLDEGEIGAIGVGDLCMGIWHDDTGNDEENSDDNRGNFKFAGFKTVYFQITSVSGDTNNEFSYILRSVDNGGNGIHPFVGMHFAGRGNTINTERQSFTYTTTEYTVSLTGVKTWDFQPSNYYAIGGHIEGFSMPAIDKYGKEYTKVFHGYGNVFGNAYIFGQLDQFERIDYHMEIEQSLGGTLAPREVEDVYVTIRNGYGQDVTSQFTRIDVTRNTGDDSTDAVWNAKHTNVSNPFQIGFNDLGIDGISKVMATFYVVATDESSDETASHELDYFS